MKAFDYIDPNSISQTCFILGAQGNDAKLIAGGTDLLLTLKADTLPDYPKTLVNIKAVDEMNFISEDQSGIKIGALATLSDISASGHLSKTVPILCQAAESVATPQIRNSATIGGNLCQDVRCCYYRYPKHIGGPLQCLRKGSGPCFAIRGDNRYHALFGAKKCFAVCPSDTAVALAALDAVIHISGPIENRSVKVTDFYSPLKNALEPGEMVTRITIPPPERINSGQAFIKFTVRKPIDFAVVSTAVYLKIENQKCSNARIVLGAVAASPLRSERAETYLLGKPVNDHTAQKAASLATENARPLSRNGYKIKILQSIIEQALLKAAQNI